MADTLRVAVLVGSLRRGSFSRKVARAAIALASNSLAMEIVEIGDLLLYNEDLEDAPAKPSPWLTFRDRIRGVDGVLFVTPEYNRSVPGVLKNALDVGSRPRVESVWSRTSCAVISVSLGAFGANHHLRQSFVFLEMPAMQQPEAYIGNAPSLFDGHGALTNEKTREFIQKIVTLLNNGFERTADGGETVWGNQSTSQRWAHSFVTHARLRRGSRDRWTIRRYGISTSS